MSTNLVRVQGSELDSQTGKNSNEEMFAGYDESSPFDDINYIRASTLIITDTLRRGGEVAQLPNGDIIVTEVKIVNSHYVYNREKQKMIKTSQN